MKGFLAFLGILLFVFPVLGCTKKKSAVEASQKTDYKYTDGSEIPTEEALILEAGNFQFEGIDGHPPFYYEANRNCLAIDASQYKDKFAAAEIEFPGESGTYHCSIETITEGDGESSYILKINGEKKADFRNPAMPGKSRRIYHTWEGLDIKKGDMIQVLANAASNKKIPEGDGFAYSRGRWGALIFLKQ